jgi:hypothetical protein
VKGDAAVVNKLRGFFPFGKLRVRMTSEKRTTAREEADSLRE